MAARTVFLTAAQVAVLVAAVVALRGAPSSERPSSRPIIGAAAPLVVYSIAILAAVVIVIAATRARRTVRRPAPTPAAPKDARRWATATWVLLALAGLAIGVLLVLGVLPHRTGTPAESAPSQSTEQTQPGTSTATPSPSTPPPPSPESARPNLLPAIFVVLPVLLVLLGAGGLLARRRAVVPNPPSVSVPGRTPDPLVRATALGLRAVSAHELNPGEAIVACYAVMERALAETPDTAPHLSDTPSEVLARAVEHGALRPASAATLVELFAEARFSRHAITEAQRHAAAAALRQVLDELGSPACVPSL